MKTFEVPVFYRSPLIAAVKEMRKKKDKLKKDFSPTLLDFGSVKIYLARHFGFCYGVENAIEIAFKTVEENKGKRIFLLSEMIHNPQVNADLVASGVNFIMDTQGNMLTPWDTISKEDVVIIPAFGTTLEIENLLRTKGINPLQYNTTCPFVERVWNKAAQIATQNYSVILHGKPSHEETKATFSHSSLNAPTLIIYDMEEAKLLAKFIKKELPLDTFYEVFANRFSAGFDVNKDLQRIGVVNQTTMLAQDTQGIADFLKQIMLEAYPVGTTNISERFADTRDTLCYATNDNQTAITGMLKQSADCSIIIGGYNSSNTSHLVELCEAQLPTYYINGEKNLSSATHIEHYNFRTHELVQSTNYLPTHDNTRILISSGASCPDAVVEKVIDKILTFYPESKNKETVLQELLSSN
jgi:4-hydroxy-3-methylbut-2-en-1-yl diphosphate reductase